MGYAIQRTCRIRQYTNTGSLSPCSLSLSLSPTLFLSFFLSTVFIQSVIGGLRRRLQVANKKIALQNTAVDEG